MTHIFVAPHPDDVALSCGGLINGLRELGQTVTILTVFSGAGGATSLSPYQREALGYGNKAIWPATEAFNRANLTNDYPVDERFAPWGAETEKLDATQRDADSAARRFWQRSSWYRRADIHNRSIEGQVLIDEVPTHGAVPTRELVEAQNAGEIAAARRLEDERYALFAEASVVFLDLPDAVYRGYEGDAELLGQPHADDEPPVAIVRREVNRLEPQRVYLPLGIGGHVDHQLLREVGLALLHEEPSWVMPGPDWPGRVVYYEDFPYAWWNEFNHLADLPPGSLANLPYDVSLVPEYADISEEIEKKIVGIDLYRSQMGPLFGGTKAMANAVRAHGRRVAALGGLGTFAERYWVSTPI